MKIFKSKARRIRKIVRQHPLESQLQKSIVVLIFLLLLHTLCMMHFEQLKPIDAFWLTMTSVTTVGYGDFSAQTTMGRLATIILIYLGSIGLLAQVLGMYFEHRQIVKRKKLSGDWRWYMKNHIVFIGAPQKVSGESIADEYFNRAITTLRQSSQADGKLPVVIISDHIEELPDHLREMNVSLVRKRINDPVALEHACVFDAHTIVLMAQNPLDPFIDSIHFELIDRIRRKGFCGNIISEAVFDNSRERLLSIGANHVVRPIRTYPELVVRTILAPGTEKVIEDMFDSVGEECIRYNVELNCEWIKIMHLFMTQNYGTPLAYLNEDHQVIISPSGTDNVKGSALFVVARENQLQNTKSLQDQLIQLIV